MQMHYKIINNLNYISSILGLQIDDMKSNSTKDSVFALMESRMRIDAIALTHRVIYDTQSIEKFDFDRYVNDLTRLINRRYNKEIILKCENNGVIFTEEFILQLGLIIYELLDKSFKNGIDKVNISILLIQGCIFYYDSNLQKSEDDFGNKLIKLIVQEMGSKLEISYEDGLLYEF